MFNTKLFWPMNITQLCSISALIGLLFGFDSALISLTISSSMQCISYLGFLGSDKPNVHHMHSGWKEKQATNDVNVGRTLVVCSFATKRHKQNKQKLFWKFKSVNKVWWITDELFSVHKKSENAHH